MAQFLRADGLHDDGSLPANEDTHVSPPHLCTPARWDESDSAPAATQKNKHLGQRGRAPSSKKCQTSPEDFSEGTNEANKKAKRLVSLESNRSDDDEGQSTKKYKKRVAANKTSLENFCVGKNEANKKAKRRVSLEFYRSDDDEGPSTKKGKKLMARRMSTEDFSEGTNEFRNHEPTSEEINREEYLRWNPAGTFKVADICGEKGDPRMNKALALLQLDPTMNHLKALREGGFNYMADVKPMSKDKDMIEL